jgi:hypothetical protein
VARILYGIALLLFACKSDKEPEPRPAAKDAPAATTTPADAAVTPAPIDTAAATIEPLEIPVAAQCESPCLLLARYRFGSISEGAYCEVCKELRPRACEIEWPPIDDEPSCDDWDTWQNCLLAAHGYRFRRARLRAEYRRQRWYKPRRRVNAARLGPVPRANLEYLQTRARACREALAARAGRTIARLRGDFDGDRRKRTAVVTDSQVRIGKARIDHGLAPSDAMSAIEATLIDIDSGDRAVEILVALHPGESAASRYVVVYVEGEIKRRRGRPGELVTGDVIETFGAVEATGDGSLEVREEVCGQTRTLVYGYQDGRLVKTRDEREGDRDPARCD